MNQKKFILTVVFMIFGVIYFYSFLSSRNQIQENIPLEDDEILESSYVVQETELFNKISTEFDIELEKAKDIVEYIEDFFYDDLYSICQDFDQIDEVCREHFEGMYDNAGYDYRY